MKQAVPCRIIILSALMCCYFCTGCAYMKSRGRDFTDIITLSGETCCANVSAQVVFFPLGLGWADGKGFGSRAGHLGSYDYREINVLTYTERKFGPESLPRGKAFEMKGFWFIIPLYYINFMPSFINYKGSLVSRCQIEVAAGLGAGLRAGVNPLELFDFLLGLTTLDILKDDFPKEKDVRLHDTDGVTTP